MSVFKPLFRPIDLQANVNTESFLPLFKKTPGFPSAHSPAYSYIAYAPESIGGKALYNMVTTDIFKLHIA
jgi:hypothetical protein